MPGDIARRDRAAGTADRLAEVGGGPSSAVVLVGFEIFVAALQAFIFAILSASYIGQAMAEEH